MANSLTNIVPQMLVRGLSVLRESVQMPFLVNRAYERLLRSDVKYRFCIDMASLQAADTQ